MGGVSSHKTCQKLKTHLERLKIKLTPPKMEFLDGVPIFLAQKVIGEASDFQQNLNIRWIEC